MMEQRLDMTMERDEATGRCASPGCGAEAVICDECRRALAFKGWDDISRHPEQGTDCRLCEAGVPQWCAAHWLDEVMGSRRALRESGHAITPPGQWIRS